MNFDLVWFFVGAFSSEKGLSLSFDNLWYASFVCLFQSSYDIKCTFCMCLVALVFRFFY